MKVVNYAKYIADQDKVGGLRPAHRQYMDELLAAGTLVVAGPFVDGSGGLFIYEVDSLDDAKKIVAADPYNTGGAFVHCELTPWDMVKINSDLLQS